MSPKIEGGLPQGNVRHEIVVGTNKVVDAAKAAPGSEQHAEAIANLADTLANRKGALEELLRLQKPK